MSAGGINAGGAFIRGCQQYSTTPTVLQYYSTACCSGNYSHFEDLGTEALDSHFSPLLLLFPLSCRARRCEPTRLDCCKAAAACGVCRVKSVECGGESESCKGRGGGRTQLQQHRRRRKRRRRRGMEVWDIHWVTHVSRVREGDCLDCLREGRVKRVCRRRGGPAPCMDGQQREGFLLRS